MPLIDDEGRFLGVVNIIDALVVLIALALLAGIVVIGTSVGPVTDSANDSYEVTISADVTPAATDELQQLANDSDSRVTDVEIVRSVYNDTEHQTFDRVRVTAVLELAYTDGRYHHQHDRVAIGSRFELDADRVIVDGRVVAIVPQEVASDAE